MQNLYRILPFIFCLLPCLAHTHKYNLSVCAIFRDEADWLQEWIDFHLKQGVQHFYLFDNLSIDNPYRVLSQYGDKITWMSWPYESHTAPEWENVQNSAFNSCIVWFQHESKWIAFLDVDEYLFCPNHQNLNDFLLEYQAFDAIGVNWVMYGTSHVTIPHGEKFLKWLLWRSKLDFGANRHIKTIAKADRIDHMPSPHYCILKHNGIEVDENKNAINGPFSNKVSVNRIRINHYWSRDLNYFYNIKLPRRLKYGDFNSQIEHESYMNDVYDPVLADY